MPSSLLPIMALLLLHCGFAFVPFSGSRSLAHSSTDTTINFSGSTQEVSLEDTLLRGVETMDQVITPEFFESSPCLKTMYSQLVKLTEIKDSSIAGAGRGLFAKKNIKSGTIVSFYPAHALGVDAEGESFVCLPPDKEYFQSHPSATSSYLHCTDQPIFQRPSLLIKSQNQEESDKSLENVPLYLDVNADRPIVDGWVSQMINDGAVVKSNSEQGVLDYYQASGLQKNCIHIPWGPSPVMATVTTKKVKKGEELFTSYGGVYWLGVLLDVHGDEGVGITPQIQEKIQETAMDLRKSMQSVAVTYAQQAKAMEEGFSELQLQ